MAVRHYDFTERVRAALTAARLESHRLGCDYVGTEHILLGLLHESAGVVDLLEVAGADQAAVQRDAEQRGRRGPANDSAEMDADLPYTSRAKKALEYAMDEASRLKAPTVDTKHLLLGLSVEGNGIAAEVLAAHNATLDRLRSAVVASSPPKPRWFERWRR